MHETFPFSNAYLPKCIFAKLLKHVRAYFSHMTGIQRGCLLRLGQGFEAFWAVVADILSACSSWSQHGYYNSSRHVGLPGRKVRCLFKTKTKKGQNGVPPPESGSFRELAQIPHSIIYCYWLFLFSGGWRKKLLEGYISTANNVGVCLVKKEGRMDVGKQPAVSIRAIDEVLTYRVCCWLSAPWSVSVLVPAPDCSDDCNIIIRVNIWRGWFLLLHSVPLACKFA